MHSLNRIDRQARNLLKAVHAIDASHHRISALKIGPQRRRYNLSRIKGISEREIVALGGVPAHRKVRAAVPVVVSRDVIDPTESIALVKGGSGTSFGLGGR